MEFENYQGQFIFALDIGTRSVIGIVGQMEDDQLKIVAEEMLEHNSRTMYDGQIHNVPKVAEAVKKVKTALEKKIGKKLHQVAVAAAGRSLITKSFYFEQSIDSNVEIDRNNLHNFEQAALEDIYQKLIKEIDNGADYHCIGHSVVTYSLDDFPMTSLIGHRGKKMGAEIIATFLPMTVINGLYSVLYRAELEPINLTLEPIAAIEVAIPEHLRLLNLALVDIGAGTSDIAISRDGSITAYGMVPLAGDKLTEEIVQACLVNFNTAEQIKRQLNHKSEITYQDILGNESTTTYDNFMEIISPVLDRLVEEICDNILKLNNSVSPRSVFCIGGGCQIPTLRQRISKRLNLDNKLVIIRDRNALENLVQNPQNLINGPDGITVIGIAAVALKNIFYDFISISVNERFYKIPKSQNITVANALCAISFDIKELVGKNNNFEFTLNGQKVVVYGEKSQPAQILINDNKATLQSHVRDGDIIVIRETHHEKMTQAYIRDYLPQDKNSVRILLNNKVAHPDTEINNGDILEITTEQALSKSNTKYNSSTVMYDTFMDDYENTLEDEALNLDAANNDSSEITFQKSNTNIKVENQITVFVNGEAVILSGKHEPIMVDIFDAIKFDTTRPQGKLIFKLNDREAPFTKPLSDGDQIEIGWEPRELGTVL